jgi:hypothetical protein
MPRRGFWGYFSKYLIYRLLFDSKIGENAFPLFFLGEKEAGLYFRSVTGPAWAGANGLADKMDLGWSLPWYSVGFRGRPPYRPWEGGASFMYGYQGEPWSSKTQTGRPRRSERTTGE